MKTKIFLGGLFIITIIALSCTAKEQEKQASQRPNIEGTYKLISRKFPDGTTQRPPNVIGLLTYTKNYRNFNVIWKDEKGKFFSYSLVSTYKLTASEYSETIIFSMLNDQIGGKDVNYDLSGPSQTVPVTMEDGRIQFKLPFDPVTVIFEGDKFTAESPDFTDHWEKVE